MPPSIRIQLRVVSIHHAPLPRPRPSRPQDLLGWLRMSSLVGRWQLSPTTRISGDGERRWPWRWSAFRQQCVPPVHEFGRWQLGPRKSRGLWSSCRPADKTNNETVYICKQLWTNFFLLELYLCLKRTKAHSSATCDGSCFTMLGKLRWVSLLLWVELMQLHRMTRDMYVYVLTDSWKVL